MQNNLSSLNDGNVGQPHKPFNVLLLGDECEDLYQYGTVERISPEAPVPIFQIVSYDSKRGMAGNVLANLITLGLNATLLSGGSKCVRTRLIDSKSKQHIVRIDKDIISDPIEFVTDIPPFYDAIVISDYNKGAITYDTVKEIRKSYSGPIFVDTKKPLLHNFDFDNVYVKINSDEYQRMQTTCSNLIVTYSTGVLYQSNWFDAKCIEVADVTGAGDTFLAALVYRFLESRDIDNAIGFAIDASAITVQHVGVYAPTLEEIYDN